MYQLKMSRQNPTQAQIFLYETLLQSGFQDFGSGSKLSVGFEHRRQSAHPKQIIGYFNILMI